MKASRPALFDAYLVENGDRRRATRDELRECHRLWFKHADIREGRAKVASPERRLGTTNAQEALPGLGGTSGRAAA